MKLASRRFRRFERADGFVLSEGGPARKRYRGERPRGRLVKLLGFLEPQRKHPRSPMPEPAS